MVRKKGKIVLKQFLSRSAKSRLHLAVSGVKFMAPFWESAIRTLETFIFLCFAVADELFSGGFAGYDKRSTKRWKFDPKGLVSVS